MWTFTIFSFVKRWHFRWNYIKTQLDSSEGDFCLINCGIGGGTSSNAVVVISPQSNGFKGEGKGNLSIVYNNCHASILNIL